MLPGAIAGLAGAGVLAGPTAAVAAAYGTVSIVGQAFSGAAQIYSSAFGYSAGAAKVEQVGTILSGPVTGLGTLLAGGSMADAARNASYESMFTGGTGFIDGLINESASLLSAAADYHMGYAGLHSLGHQICH